MRIPRCRLSELWLACRNGVKNRARLADMVASSYAECLGQDPKSSLGSRRLGLLEDCGYRNLSDSKPLSSIMNAKIKAEDIASRQLLILSLGLPGFTWHSALRFATFSTISSFAACHGEDDSFTPRTRDATDKRMKDAFMETPTVRALDGREAGHSDASSSADVNLSSGFKSIHPTAIVHPDAIISEDVIIGPFCTIGRGVKLGRGCFLHPSSHIHGNTELGEKCILYTGAVVGSDIPGCTVIGKENSFGHYAVVGLKCQDLKYKEGDDSNLYIGQNNDIREYVSIHRSSKSSDQTVIGSQNLIMGTCHIAHDCKLGNHNILANGTLLGGHVVVQVWTIDTVMFCN